MTVTSLVSSLHSAHTARTLPSSSAHLGHGVAPGLECLLLSLPRASVAAASSSPMNLQSMRHTACSLNPRGFLRRRLRTASDSLSSAALSPCATRATSPAMAPVTNPIPHNPSPDLRAFPLGLSLPSGFLRKFLPMRPL